MSPYLESLFQTNFLEYASYVIKDRAIPHVDDGLKPVQRRILHTLFEMHDGNFHKVANVMGSCMKYHPHGDASIGPALVLLANKDLFIEKQGNFGNPFTGDIAAAPRYIECRLTKLAHLAMYQPEITEYVPSYDGRNKEPVVFPAKLPVLLAHGAEGIAVGMATKILPHNLIELLNAQVKVLQNKTFDIYPDFYTGGEVDVSEYGDGNGKVLVRAKLDTSDPKRIVVTEIPYGLTTESLISSIEAAARKQKIKVAKISDYTTDHVEVEILMQRGVNSKDVVDALYAFTDCQVSISTNLLVIKDNRPVVMTITDVIKHNAEQLVNVLEAELELEEAKLLDKLHAKTLEQIFIENRVYKRIEDKKTPEAVVKAVLDGLKPFNKQIKREVTKEDVDTLLKIPIRRISLYDINKAKKEMTDIRVRLKEIKAALSDIVGYTISFLKGLIKEYKKQFPRRTVVADIEEIDVRDAAKRDLKLRYDKSSGYLGTKVATGVPVMDVSPYDRVLVMRKNAAYSVMDVPEKLYVGKGMLHCGFVDKDLVFTIIFRDKKTGYPCIKRCIIDKFILNKGYELVPEGATMLRMTTAEGKSVEINYKPKPRVKILQETYDVQDFPIRGNKAGGIRIANREMASGKFV